MPANELIKKCTKSEVFNTLLDVLKQDSDLKVLHTEQDNIFCVPQISDTAKLRFGKSEYNSYITQFHFTISETPIQINYEFLIIPALNSQEEKRNLADFIIENNNNLIELENQIERTLERLWS